MGKYLKLFDTHNEYETFKQTEDFILPNVSHCITENHVHYNPFIPPFFCKLTLNDDSVVEIEGSGELTNAMLQAYINTCVSAEIGDTCTSIGLNAFKNCSGLTSVTIGNSTTSIGSNAFTNCQGLVSVDIPDSVTNIDTFAFYGCTNITNVIIGSGITNIGNSAFYGCSNLSLVTVKATTPPSLVNSAFSSTNINSGNIYVPSASVNTYKAASGWSSYASRIQAIPTT